MIIAINIEYNLILYNNMVILYYIVIKVEMKKTILASNNEHKIKEFKEIFSDCEILSLNDI